ncbi:MAG TPA: sigma-70 family RNA polymerase sigma factor, partial [Thermoanaerobaculia bacterium]|nr:sigma-70 family RNA polymerase sigma factor [Thermoanaerobaculia bacterium]
DARSLETLLERHQAQVYRFGMKMCRDPEDARDVLQDTLLAMARNVRDFRGASSISTWLYTIARSFCIKKRRRSKFAPERERSLDSEAAPEAARLADPAAGADEALAGKEVEQALERGIRALEPIYREVLLLRDVEGLTAPEVAEVLGVSVAAVKSRLHRARLSVRAHVAPILGVPSEPGAALPGTCPDVLTLLSQHLEDEISAGVCADMERHVEACARCRGACDSLKQTLALCRGGPPARVPAAVQDSVRAALRKFLAEHPPEGGAR